MRMEMGEWGTVGGGLDDGNLHPADAWARCV